MEKWVILVVMKTLTGIQFALQVEMTSEKYVCVVLYHGYVTSQLMFANYDYNLTI